MVFELRKTGFATTKLTVDPRSDPVATCMLSPTPGVIRFKERALTGCGASRGRVAVGLQGGKLGIAWLNDASRHVVARLKGLSAVDGLPVVTSHRVIFRNNLAEIVCHSVSTGAQEWTVKLGGAVDLGLLVKNDRVFAVDRTGKLACLRAVTGKELWTHQLDGLASGPPTSYGNTRILIASQTGAVFVLNMTGKILPHYAVKVAISSRLLVAAGVIVLRTTDGMVRGLDINTGAELWKKDAGGDVREDEIVMASDGRAFYHIAKHAAKDEWLVKRDLHKGTQLKAVQLSGEELRFGPIAEHGNVYVVVREKIRVGDKNKYRDLLLSFDEENLRLQWRFRDGGEFRGRMFGDGGEVFVTGSKGQVYRFK
jgi:outer membrane protein assembly factor BamB